MNEWATREALQFSNVHDMRQYTHAAQYAKLPGSFPHKKSTLWPLITHFATTKFRSDKGWIHAD